MYKVHYDKRHRFSEPVCGLVVKTHKGHRITKFETTTNRKHVTCERCKRCINAVESK